MKIRYNSPTVLTYAFLSAIVLVLSQFFFHSLTELWFAVPGKGGFDPGRIRSWVTLFTHVVGHASWNHLLSNFAFILLIGPMLETSYGSLPLLVMIAITALVTGALNVLLFRTALLGASGVVFMMILLASFTNFNEGEIPLTFILVLALYIGRELFNSFSANNVSEFAHIAGGFCGSLFGFFRSPKRSNV
ncbi:rhomboid family protein [Treponema primitia ZAS-2]|uniref:Rhomboid family protein n=1 Tax=Treponema primitia (strain ATCC BAA-887 / DSM 12427 / ZAS-2) TaxID=545694 RepID=F5YPY0_TREPZ|nr:rhomboid family intramembrane serine protease [Treponema primitia]AEF85983.1 rhomboid family protein [Treponema primitia ZAS-2]